jgi:hypothetical protein
MDREFHSFGEFYPHYLDEHRNPACRRLHFAGTALLMAILAGTMIIREWWLLALLPVVGYGFAWIGHFAFEHNRPATFKHPWYSLAGDFMMFRDMLAGRVPF